MRVIIFGAPGAGKGTQAEMISRRFGIPIIGTGAMIRNAIKLGSPLGQKAKNIIDQGHLVPDALVVALVEERIAQEDCKKGFILDGFPRTISQAEALDAMKVPIDAVLDIDVDDETIKLRLMGRKVCEDCGISYHTEHRAPLQEEKCDYCGGRLVRRVDDNPETIAERLEVYHEMTEPLKQYYAKQGRLHTVNGAATIDETTMQLTHVLESLYDHS